MSHRRPALPLLLEAFPDVPTFIPVSPATPAASGFPASPNPPAAVNPPPSRPPAAPLPPVPGPSRISDTDTLLFLQSAPSRSRRSSRLSNRDSVASNRSDLSVSTYSSPQTPSSAAQSLHRPSLAFSIDEHSAVPDDLLRSAPLQDIRKAPLDHLADLTVDVPVLMPSSQRSARATPPRTTPRRESISLSSVAIPGPDSDTEPDFDALDSSIDSHDPRAPSPDIAAILATTPRPHLTALSHRPADLPHDEPWEEDFIDDYGQLRGSSVYAKAAGPYAFGYPEVDDPDAESVGGDDDHVWDEPNDSDSDLDLHTSLPQLMLHHGFLSPRSKLLSAEAGPSLTPSPSSAVFPNTDPLARDSRDTPKRRVRHRDGKTLAGGIGLTTGLGWSDSEDEDAPSALTRRISLLNLSRSASHTGLSRASSFSTRTSTYGRSSAESRSTSRARRTQSEYDEPDVDEFGAWSGRKNSSGSAPPTSWARRSEPGSRLSRAQSQTSLGPRIMRTPSMRTDDSAHTTASAMSLPLMRSRSRVLRVMLADKEKPLPRPPSLRRNPSTASQFGPTTPSGLRPRAVTGVTAASLPKPTPKPVSHIPLSMQSTPQPGGPPSASGAAAPPMPAPGAKSQMRPLRLPLRQPVLGGDRSPVPVPAVLNVGGLPTSTTASSLASSTSTSSTFSASTSATSVSLLSPSASYANVPSRSPSPSPYARGPSSPGFAPGTPTTPTTPMYDQTGIARPRPRTGTGMVYRTSSTYGARLPPPRASAQFVAL
ncbi:hypothetical protein B0H17DRAFT_1141196 [Mycena rosella]|uniref:Uncharacterized protein n=1 Tax=Mycena rosella TaxID=1033263 RepID=A0AAD7D049_MYCRO|nr:hypothetical protein B0H17DRAFT_1141196 [Mycena rosella]